MPMDFKSVNNIVRLYEESGIPVTTHLWVSWSGPNQDVCNGVFPLVIEPLFHYGRQKLDRLTQHYSYLSIIAQFYGEDAMFINAACDAICTPDLPYDDRAYVLGRTINRLLRERGLMQ